MTKHTKTQEAEIVEEKGLTVTEQSLDKPQHDTDFAHEAAKILVGIVKQKGWAIKLGGQSEHLMYEAWQTLGKYYGYTVKTGDTEYVVMQAGDKVLEGFKAKAVVIDERTGIEVGSADAYCTRDERNWSTKPPFQLASMAQTRAGSKALRQILGFVVALAGYSPTPAEEMDSVSSGSGEGSRSNLRPVTSLVPEKVERVLKLMKEKGKTTADLQRVLALFKIEALNFATENQLDLMIKNLEGQEAEEIDIDKIDKEIGGARGN